MFHSLKEWRSHLPLDYLPLIIRNLYVMQCLIRLELSLRYFYLQVKSLLETEDNVRGKQENKNKNTAVRKNGIFIIMREICNICNTY